MSNMPGGATDYEYDRWYENIHSGNNENPEEYEDHCKDCPDSKKCLECDYFEE